MGNTYPLSAKRGERETSLPLDEDDSGWAGDDHDMVSLLEENARLRALVVKLSDLVLRNVLDQK